jgi:HlyD family secretion protein
MSPDTAPPRRPLDAPAPLVATPSQLPALPPRIPRKPTPRDPWPKRWRWRLPALGLVLVAAGYAAAPRILGPVVAPIAVARGDLVASVVATGRVETPFRVTIASQITGTIAAIPVAEGQEVEAGQLVIALADTEARAAIAQAEAALAQAEARLNQIENVALPVAREILGQNEANLANAQRTYDRAAQLRAGGSGTEAQLDEARRALTVAQALVRSARVQVAGLSAGGSDRVLAETQVAEARASLEVARARLAYTQIRAPLAGTLIARNVAAGWVVQPGQALMVLSPKGRTQLVVQIDEKNFGLIALGQPALASADAFPAARFAARVAYISPAIDPQRASVEVKLDVAEPPDYLRQDMTVSVDIAVAERRDVVVVPLSAVHDLGGPQPFVLVVAGGHAVRRDVRLGLRGPSLVEVRDGLNTGERVLPAGTAVVPGGRVRAP